MTNIKISEKGKAFMKRGDAALKVISAIVANKTNFSSNEELVVKIGNESFVVKSAASTGSK